MTTTNHDAPAQPPPQPSSSSGHVRPKVKRNHHRQENDVATKVPENDLDALVEETRRKVDSWLTVGVSSAAATDVRLDSNNNNSDGVQEETAQGKQPMVVTPPPSTANHSKPNYGTEERYCPKGILKKAPKYSKVPSAADKEMLEEDDSLHATTTSQEQQQQQEKPLMKDVVVERQNVSQRADQPSVGTNHSSSMIEGYTPKTTTTQNNHTFSLSHSQEEESWRDMQKEQGEQGDEPLVLSSMSELLAAATTGNNKDMNATTATTTNTTPQVLETDLEFSVMAPEQYDEAMEEERCRLNQVFLGRTDIFDQEENQEDTDAAEMSVEDNNNSSPNNDDALLFELEMLMESDENFEEEYHQDDNYLDNDSMPPPEPRAFLRLWTALSDWVTPEAIQLAQKWQKNTKEQLPVVQQVVVDRSDVGASRCAGLQSILKMQLSKINLFKSEQDQRWVEHRLADLTKSFSYSEPNPRLSTKLWRCMTDVLVCIVKNETPDKLPESAQNVGMTLPEFQYLCGSAMMSLDGNTKPTTTVLEPGE